MPSSASPILRLELQNTGENLNSWGTRLNTVTQLLEQAIGAQTTVSLTGNYTLSTSNYIADESRNAVIKLTGTPGATFKITVPSSNKGYWFINTTANDQTVGTASGVSVTVRANRMAYVYCDGTDCRIHDPTLDVINKAAADVDVNSHKLINVADPVSAQHAATKNYVDTKALDTFAKPVADVSINGHKLTNVATPTTNTDGASKGYVDGVAFGGALPAGGITGQLVWWAGSVANWTAQAMLNATGTQLLPKVGGTGGRSRNFFNGAF